MEVKCLNNTHKTLISKYIKGVQGIMYEYTDEMESMKFQRFNNVLQGVIDYSNDFKEDNDSGVFMDEWIYMIPNLTYHSVLGFVAGTITDSNIESSVKYSKKILEMTLEVIGRCSDILNDYDIKHKIIEDVRN
tara:strand:- start:1074 stop:1472 length:399 start_codon:yes stop_codon:yes gene_type:complete